MISLRNVILTPCLQARPSSRFLRWNVAREQALESPRRARTTGKRCKGLLCVGFSKDENAAEDLRATFAKVDAGEPDGRDDSRFAKNGYFCTKRNYGFMIIDTMSKTEVMRSIREEFDTHCYPIFSDKLYKYRDIAFKQIGRTNKAVRKTFLYPTPNGLEFELQLTITKIQYKALFYLPFYWRGRYCYATLSDERAVDVFQSHALARYSERILDDNNSVFGLKGIVETIAPKMGNCFSIVLPTPTHTLSQYFAAASALFLGDYDPKITDRFYWHNTCISPREMGQSQYCIVRTLNELASAIDKTGINPFLTESPEDISEKQMAEYLMKQPDYEKEYVDLLQKEYLLFSLGKEFSLPEKLTIETAPVIQNLENKLRHYGILPTEYLQSKRQIVEQMASEIEYRGDHC